MVTGARGSGDRAGPGISGYGPWVWLALALVAVLAVAIGWSTPARAGYASIIVNAETGEVLHAVNADDRHYPASLTKVMTLYLVFDALRDKRLTMDTEVPISAHAARQPASHLGLQAGDRIKVRDAILALIIKSANDVAAALGEKLGGTERKFSYLMNAKARELGMSHTTFRNASGLPNRQQFTTARDFARLVQALQKNYPGYYKLFSTRSFTWRGKTIDTHNRLLDRYEGADGVKTGYIRASGFNLATSARRAGLRLIGVVMGARSPRARDLHMMGLLERGFEKATDGRYIAYDYDRNLRVDSWPRRRAAPHPRGARAGRPWRRPPRPPDPAPPPGGAGPHHRRGLCARSRDSGGSGAQGAELGDPGGRVLALRPGAPVGDPRHAPPAEPAGPYPRRHRAEPRERQHGLPGAAARARFRPGRPRLRAAQGQEHPVPDGAAAGCTGRRRHPLIRSIFRFQAKRLR